MLLMNIKCSFILRSLIPDSVSLDLLYPIKSDLRKYLDWCGGIITGDRIRYNASTHAEATSFLVAPMYNLYRKCFTKSCIFICCTLSGYRSEKLKAPIVLCILRVRRKNMWLRYNFIAGIIIYNLARAVQLINQLSIFKISLCIFDPTNKDLYQRTLVTFVFGTDIGNWGIWK